MRETFELWGVVVGSWLTAWLEPLPRRGDLGWRGERLAARYLRRRGYVILESRARDRTGEADLICLRGSALIFVEVKTRRDQRHGMAEWAVDRTKRRRLILFAERYVMKHELGDWRIRYDVVGIDWRPGGRPSLRHYPDAFDATESLAGWRTETLR